VVEFTSATCTQFYNPTAGDWARDSLARLDIPIKMLPEVVPPATVLGPLNVSMPEQADLSIYRSPPWQRTTPLRQWRRFLSR
jgi:rhamnulokinase